MITQLRHIILVMVLAVSAVTVVPAVVSAHDSTDVNIHVNCDTRKVTVDVGYANFHGNGEYLHVTTDVEGHEFYDDSEALNGSGVFHVGPHPIVYDVGSVLVTVEVYNPDGSVIDGSKVVYPRYHYDCPSQPKPYYRTIVSTYFCSDPFERWVVKNRGNAPDKVLIRYRGRDGVVKIVKVVPADMVWRTGWRFVVPNTRVYVKSLTQGKILLEIWPKDADYGRCYRVKTGLAPLN